MSREVGATPLGNFVLLIIIVACFIGGAYFTAAVKFMGFINGFFKKEQTKIEIATKVESKTPVQVQEEKRQSMAEAVKKANVKTNNINRSKKNTSIAKKKIVKEKQEVKQEEFNEFDDTHKRYDVEAPDKERITSVKEYDFVSKQVLPPVSGVSAYKFDDSDPVVVFPINVWGGWLPLVAFNKGFEPNTESWFYKKYGFKVKLKIIDDQVTARNCFASGECHTLWGTLDSIALFANDLMRDSRTAPRIYQLMDWSNGNDGIVARSNIRSISDLEGKKIVYAQNSSSQYFLSTMLMNAEIPIKNVTHMYVSSPLEAAAAFVADKSIDACVSWAPDIYRIPESVAGTHILTTTADANRLIANCWAVRADFARDNPVIVRGLVSGIFEGLDMIKENENVKNDALIQMSEAFGMTQEAVALMCNYSYGANCGENKEFFLNMNNPTNFERTWENINTVYGMLGKIIKPIRFSSIGNAEIIKILSKSVRFRDQKAGSRSKTAAVSYKKLSSAPVLTQVVRINFYPNSTKVFEPDHDENGKELPGTLYDPSVEAVIEKVARVLGQFGSAKVVVVGHSDNSLKGQVDEESVNALSLARAKSVCSALVKRYGFSPKKFKPIGKGWSEPFDPKRPNDHAMNRRVEIQIYTK